MKLEFKMLTHLTHIKTTFEYYHASMILGNEGVLYLEDRNVYRLVLKIKPQLSLLCPLCYKLITTVNCYLETGLSCIVY